MEDDYLLSELKRGNKKALCEIFRIYYKIVLAYLVKLSNNLTLSEDIAQSCFVDLWSKRKTLKIHTSIKKYLFSMAYNSFVDDYHKKVKEQNSYREYWYVRSEDEEDDQGAFENIDDNIEKMQSLIGELPPRCREILLLSKQERLKYREIAERLNISVKTVEAQMCIAMKKLREGFKK
ncbi:RNA polymerase sigma-70 factor [Sinomicrobium weinanense]|uniref:RNA polymerase sigma-70 factor n=1 Tax=Sinomicrobium weinanense TaxID=2842200 RepID=A0A926Q2Y4_9FLAO|nr:RNA polymerase sigma-70 factor [Sinomicrobium weinanense]MBC9795431.1 RNA polymerase sigma-70 factor [Sinomicrobium weinanense]MBU3123956.1 RNA polymerase sigma-70 factor [Sinomicrobium weinanense]